MIPPLKLDEDSQLVLRSLEEFREKVWGNESVFRKTLQEAVDDQPATSLKSREAEFLDFGDHLKALQSICMPLVDVHKLLVFQEYREAIETFDRGGVPYKKGACIIGQSGIGKSSFIAYAIIHRLRHKQPVAVQVRLNDSQDAYILFAGDGVNPYGSGTKFPLEQHPGVWALADSNSQVQTPINAFKNTVGVRIFQTTSPLYSRWHTWTKEAKVKLYVMDLPSTQEIENLAVLSGYDPVMMTNFARKWGNVPRLLDDLCLDPSGEESHQEEVADACNDAIQKTKNVLASIGKGNALSSQGASYVFYTVPSTVGDVKRRTRITACIPTHWIMALLADLSTGMGTYEQAVFFNTLASHPKACIGAGWMFERFFNSHLARGQKPIKVTWTDSGSSEEIPIPKDLPIRRNLSDLTSLPPFYWHPDQDNFPGIDAVLVLQDRILPIQMTIRRTHGSPKKGVDKVWGEMSSDQRDLKWQILFLGSDNGKIWDVSRKYVNEVTDGAGRKLQVGYVTMTPDSHLWKNFKYTMFLDPTTGRDLEEEAVLGEDNMDTG